MLSTFRSSVLALLLATPSAAQLAGPGTPATQRHPRVLPTDVPVVVLPHPDVDALMREDEARNHRPWRYGAAIPTALSSDDHGQWDVLPSGELVWRLALLSPGARSLGLLFDVYDLPASGELYLYSPGYDTVLGAYSAATRQANGMLAVQPVFGEQVVIEYVQPARDPGRPTLRVGEVVHDYRGLLDQLAIPEAQMLSGGCLIDIVCPPAAAYQDIKRSVVMVIAGGALCSAGLLNNTDYDGTPYFLTANHCGNMTNVVAVFNYENPVCDVPGGSSQSQSVSGATLLAASTLFDSQLYRLDSAPPPAFQPYFAGWDRTDSPPGPALSISHPNGFPKKFARDNDAPIVSGQDFFVDWEAGKIEPGSSGSPLFSAAERVIGPACCVSGFACNAQWAYYGRFGGFYEQRNLGQWLDPAGSDPEGLDGYDPAQGLALVYNGNGGNPVIYRSVTPPTLGTTWVAEVNTATLPTTTNTLLMVYRQPLSGVMVSQGELLVNTALPLLYSSLAAPVANLAQHSAQLPNNAALIGQVFYSQAVLLTSTPRLLTNGLELRLR
jgi:hypothetical protein